MTKTCKHTLYSLGLIFVLISPTAARAEFSVGPSDVAMMIGWPILWLVTLIGFFLFWRIPKLRANVRLQNWGWILSFLPWAWTALVQPQSLQLLLFGVLWVGPSQRHTAALTLVGWSLTPFVLWLVPIRLQRLGLSWHWTWICTGLVYLQAINLAGILSTLAFLKAESRLGTFQLLNFMPAVLFLSGAGCVLYGAVAKRAWTLRALLAVSASHLILASDGLLRLKWAARMTLPEKLQFSVALAFHLSCLIFSVIQLRRSNILQNEEL